MNSAKSPPPAFPTPWPVAADATVDDWHVRVPTARWVARQSAVVTGPNQARIPEYLRLQMRPAGTLKKFGLRPVLRTTAVPGNDDKLLIPAGLQKFCPADGTSVAVTVSTKLAHKRFRASQSKAVLAGTTGGGIGTALIAVGSITTPLNAGLIVVGAIGMVSSAVLVAIDTLRDKS